MLNIYISHLWDTGDGRQRLRRLLDENRAVPWSDLSLTRAQALAALDQGDHQLRLQTDDFFRQIGELEERMAETAERLALQRRVMERGGEVGEVVRPLQAELQELEQAGAGDSFIASLRVKMEKEVAALLEVDEALVTPETIFSPREALDDLQALTVRQRDELRALEADLSRPSAKTEVVARLDSTEGGRARERFMTRHLAAELSRRIRAADLFLLPLTGAVQYLPWLLEELAMAGRAGLRPVAVSFVRISWLITRKLRPHEVEVVDGRDRAAAARLANLATAADNPYR